MDSSRRFSGKTVVITGSGTGIGHAIAKRFAREGANIVIMGRRKEPLDQTLTLLNDIISTANSSAKAVAYPGIDVSDENGISSMFEDVKRRFQKVDILVNNAGVSGPVKVFTNASTKDFRDCVAIHLTGTFWTSVNALRVMNRGGKIITISTFFSEENRYEQRPYRFRTPYTAAQGAKNRLAEALAWELVQSGIFSIATNPGPVHSDRIYKTVYPKAAAEFVRIGGYPDLVPRDIERVTNGVLPVLGESDDVVKAEIQKVAQEIVESRRLSTETDLQRISTAVSGCLNKIQEIAEKIQNNTSKMIVNGEFLSQDDVAEMVANLSEDKISSLINGRVIPNDRVFYPVKPAVGTAVPNRGSVDLSGKVVVLTTTSSSEKEIARIKKIASLFQSLGSKQTIVLSSSDENMPKLAGIHAHRIDLLDEEALRRIFNTAKIKFGQVDAVIHFTGDYNYEFALSSLSRADWDQLVDKFVFVPALIAREATNAMAPAGAIDEPSKYKSSSGTIIIVGPDAPTGKVSGTTRARSEVFRGALRPFIVTANQELADVLNSDIRVFLILCGNIDGKIPDGATLENSVAALVARAGIKVNESIFYIDESRK